MVTISDTAKALLALTEELAYLNKQALVVNQELASELSRQYNAMRSISDKHYLILERMTKIEEAIEETKKLLCEGSNSYSSKG